MDRWKLFDIIHRDHVICNPLSLAKVDELIELLDLPVGARVLDIGCGKGEVLARIVERYQATGVGVDLSPPFVLEATRRLAERGLAGRVEIVEQDGATYAVAPGSFDLAICLGASWIFGGYRGTLRALAAAVGTRGLVVSGEPYWKRRPDPEYLVAAEMKEDLFGTHASNVAAGVDEGLTPLYALVSSDDDWDRYECLHWLAADRYAVEHPDDPDVAELVQRMPAGRDRYLRWERDTLGWAVYLFRK